MAQENHSPLTCALEPGVQAQLQRLSLALRLGVALRGLGWSLVALVAAAWVSLVTDYGLYRLTVEHLSLNTRLLVNGACLALCLLVAWKRLLRSVFRSYSDADLASLVERCHPQLQDRLLSAIHFALAGGEGHGASVELMRKVAHEANQAARALRFSSVLRFRPVWVALSSAGGFVALSGASLWAIGDVAEPWAARNLLLKDSSYPKQTVLRIAGPDPIRVMRGDPLSLTVTAQAPSVAPERVIFHMRFPSLGETSESVAGSPQDRRAYVKLFPMVNEPFRFYVTGNDDRTEWRAVEVVEPPDLRELDVEVRSPVYTNVPPKKVRRGVSTLDVPEDGGLVLAGLATKDLDEVRLLVDDQEAGNVRIVPDSGGAPRRVEAQLALRPARPFRPVLSLRIVLRDTEGFENPKAASYHLTLRQDQPPSVCVEAVRMGGDITSQAAIPLAVTSRDDYGVAALHLDWSVQSAPQKTQQELLRAYTPSLVEPQAVEFVFDLRQATAQGEGGAPPLQVGETLRLQAMATDTRPPASGGAQKSLSNLLTFRIVTAEELVAKSLDAQRALREQIGQTVEMQTDARDRCRSALAQARQATTAGLAFREAASILDTQQQIEDLLSGVLKRLEVLLEQLRNNRALAGEDELRLRLSVIEPLRQIIQQAVGPLVRRFEAAKALAGERELAAELEALIPLQDTVIRGLEAVVAEMIKVESAQHVESSLRTLIKMGDQVREIMKQKKGPEETPPKPGPDNR